MTGKDGVVVVRIDPAEWYPVFEFTDSAFGSAVEVDAATLARWQAAFAEFWKVQSEMEAAFDEANA